MIPHVESQPSGKLPMPTFFSFVAFILNVSLSTHASSNCGKEVLIKQTGSISDNTGHRFGESAVYAPNAYGLGL